MAESERNGSGTGSFCRSASYLTCYLKNPEDILRSRSIAPLNPMFRKKTHTSIDIHHPTSMGIYAPTQEIPRTVHRSVLNVLRPSWTDAFRWRSLGPNGASSWVSVAVLHSSWISVDGSQVDGMAAWPRFGPIVLFFPLQGSYRCFSNCVPLYTIRITEKSTHLPNNICYQLLTDAMPPCFVPEVDPHS